MTQLRTRRWEELLTPEQKEKYSNAIRKGYFATYDGYAWRHTFYGAFIWKHPGRVKVVNIFKSLCTQLRTHHLCRGQRRHTRKLVQTRSLTQVRRGAARQKSTNTSRLPLRRGDSTPQCLQPSYPRHAPRQTHLHARMSVRSTSVRLHPTHVRQPRTRRTYPHLCVHQDTYRSHRPRPSLATAIPRTHLATRASDTLRTGIQHQHTRNVQGVRHRHRSKGVPCRTRPTGTQVRVRIHTHWAPLLRNQPRPQRRSDRANRDDDGTHVRQRTQHSHDPTLHHGAALTIPRSLRSLPPARCRKDRTRAANTRQVYPRLTSLPVAFTYKKMPFYAIA